MYAWPTYADFLGYEFDHYENWGFPGLGNRAIAQRVAECHAKNKFTKDDVVIVQWSTHTRNDWHTFRSANFEKGRGDPIRNTDEIGWKTKGSIFNYMNREICYNDHWINTFWNEESYFMHGMNSIALVQGLLESTGCTWRMTSIGEMNKLGTDMPDAPEFGEKTQETADVFVDNEQLKVYNKLFSHKNFLEPLGLFAWKLPEKTYKFWDPKNNDYWTEMHPSHWQHWEYLNTVLKPSLGLNTENNDKQLRTMKKLDQLKEANRDLVSFEEGILSNIVEYKHIGYVGF